MRETSAQKGNEAELSEKSAKTLELNVDRIIRNHVYVALAVGLIPIPFMDFVGVTGVQLNMMRKLARIYKIPFSKDMVKNLIGALIGGSFPASFGPRIASSVTKAVPVIGFGLGAISASALSGACTYAIGKVFSRHFAEGGTFLCFNPDTARAFYEEMFREGQTVVSELKHQKKG